MKIHLAPKLALSAEAVTQTFGILGKRGSGKTTTASVFAEELLRLGYPMVIVDPTESSTPSRPRERSSASRLT